MALRVLVVDDTAIFRKILSEVLAEIPGVEVIGVAHNGRMALARIQSLQPDLVTLDIEMPEMDGLEVMSALRDQGLEVGVVLVSAFTRHGSEMTIRGLELGAFDFITKPSDGDYHQNREKIRKALDSILRAYTQRQEIRSILKRPPRPEAAPTVAPTAPVAPTLAPAARAPTAKLDPAMVVIGVSTGGPNALARLIPALPASLGVPVLIVQHMPAIFTRSLAESLDKQSPLQVKEAEHAEPALPGSVYFAPGSKQMKVTTGVNGSAHILITDDPPENNCKPAADTLFRSAAHQFPGRVCAVIMTGMGSDGTLGLRLIKRHPAWIIAQDEASCVVFGMPKAAIAAGVVDAVLPLDRIAGEIARVAARK